MRGVVSFACLALLVPATACTGVRSDTGDEALMQVSGAQYFAGATPTGESGPAVTDIEAQSLTAQPGEVGYGLTGRLAQGSSSVALQIDGDVGYWVLPGGVADDVFKGEITYDAKMNFSRRLTPGGHAVTFRAIDSTGKFGPPRAFPLFFNSPNPQLSGSLVITLAWDTESDLDLHVIDPNGTEIWRGHPTSIIPPQPGTCPPDAGAPVAVGVLDRDSNAQCVIDGRRQEDVVWKDPPLRGHYEVRVDAFSMCGQPDANWHVDAIGNDNVDAGGGVIAAAQGVMTQSDTNLPHGSNAGVAALSFDIH